MGPEFNPRRDEYCPCWHCTHFGGMLYQGTAARCTRPGACAIAAQPVNGCAFWIREIGADDEPAPFTIEATYQSVRLAGAAKRRAQEAATQANRTNESDGEIGTALNVAARTKNVPCVGVMT